MQSIAKERRWCLLTVLASITADATRTSAGAAAVGLRRSCPQISLLQVTSGLQQANKAPSALHLWCELDRTRSFDDIHDLRLPRPQQLSTPPTMSAMFRATRILRADVAGAMKSAGEAMKKPGEAAKSAGRPQDSMLKRGAKRDPELYVRADGGL